MNYLEAARSPFHLTDCFETYLRGDVDRSIELLIPLVGSIVRTHYPYFSETQLEDLVSGSIEKIWKWFVKGWWSKDSKYAFLVHARTVLRRHIISMLPHVLPRRTVVDYSYRHTRPRHLSVTAEVDLRTFQQELPKLVEEAVLTKNRYPQLAPEVCRYVIKCCLEKKPIAKPALKNWLGLAEVDFFIGYVRLLCYWSMYEIRGRYRSLLEFSDSDHEVELLTPE